MNYRLGIITSTLLFAIMPVMAEDFETAGMADSYEEDVIKTQTVLFELGNVSGLGGDYIPFHIYANRHGILSPNGSQTYNRGLYSCRWDTSDKWSFETGADLYFYHSKQEIYYTHHLHLQQLYLKVNWGQYALQLGSKEEEGEFVPALSSGNMLWSGNTHPAPSFRFGLDKFVPTFITGNLFEVKFNIRWSKQTDGNVNRKIYSAYENNYAQEGYVSRYWDNITDHRQHAKVENAWFHHKSFFLRTTAEQPLFLTLGFEHAVLYGGKVNGENCSGAWNWLRGMLGGSGKKEGNQFNHALTQNYRIDYHEHRYAVGLYKQHYADDMDGGLFSCGADGLWGIDVKLHRSRQFNKIVFEYLQSTNQGGVVYANDVDRFDKNHVYRTAGNSNFYHDQHMGSWTHYGMILGNPLLATPLYNKDYYPDMTSNMLRAFHLAFSGNLLYRLDYVIRYQHTDSWGTPYAPFGEVRTNNSWGMDLCYNITDAWRVLGSIAFDRGSLYGDNTGCHLNIQYEL